MSEAETPIPASDLPVRFAMGVAMIAVAVAAVWFGGWPFRLLVVTAAAVMMIEWGDMHRVSRRKSAVAAVLMALFLIVVPERLYPAGEMDETVAAASFLPVWTGFGAALAAALLAGLFTRRVMMAGGFLYIALPSFALIVLDWTWVAITFWVLLVTWATDIFAYFAGRSIGGPKLAPRLSPNKTWAGLGGGMLGAAVIGWAAADFFEMGAPFLYVGAAMGAIAQGGDLYESWMKRRAGVKDSGTILPGHGGALDRLDGLLPVVLATLFMLMAGLWAA
ncbi:phosphatidate cytidylyltransferase [Allosphingosinicella indica]|uniref:Phosphatidate cytidylyltransferase n=1 Tax=Allosphingosinicella indica TaxID=941907 RepID=A0A1X7GXY7_9SPHN|nr:phosphatidate cytidylyltransferase [Allosphingosinicella indica]SMF76489.1 phosphatidate cytidylyltransferase [Allosphingosinicella indica]